VLGVPSEYLTFTYTRPIGREDVAYTVQGTDDLSGTWSGATSVGAAVNNGNGTETLTYRYPTPLSGSPRQFMRLRMTTLP
jgi:hypothetical protein